MIVDGMRINRYTLCTGNGSANRMTGWVWRNRMNWAVGGKNNAGEVDYIRGSDAATPEDAERMWRESRRLFFMEVVVRRTTPDEDRRLAMES